MVCLNMWFGHAWLAHVYIFGGFKWEAKERERIQSCYQRVPTKKWRIVISRDGEIDSHLMFGMMHIPSWPLQLLQPLQLLRLTRKITLPTSSSWVAGVIYYHSIKPHTTKRSTDLGPIDTPNQQTIISHIVSDLLEASKVCITQETFPCYPKVNAIEGHTLQGSSCVPISVILIADPILTKAANKQAFKLAHTICHI